MQNSIYSKQFYLIFTHSIINEDIKPESYFQETILAIYQLAYKLYDITMFNGIMVLMYHIYLFQVFL